MTKSKKTLQQRSIQPAAPKPYWKNGPFDKKGKNLGPSYQFPPKDFKALRESRKSRWASFNLGSK